MKDEENNIIVKPNNGEKNNYYWSKFYTPFITYDGPFFIFLTYLFFVGGIVWFVFQPISLKWAGIVFSIIAFFLFLYDLIYKRKIKFVDENDSEMIDVRNKGIIVFAVIKKIIFCFFCCIFIVMFFYTFMETNDTFTKFVMLLFDFLFLYLMIKFTFFNDEK